MKVTIDCEICGGEGGIWKGGTIPVACPAECDNGQVVLEGADAADEMERQEIAAKRYASRAGARAYLAHESFDPPLYLRAELQIRWRVGYLEELAYAVDCDPEDAAKEIWAIESDAFRAEGVEAHRVAVSRYGVAQLDNVEGGPYDAASPEGQAWLDGWLAADEPGRQGRMDDCEKFVGVADEPTAPPSAVALVAAEGRSGSLARPAIAALDLDPFAVGVEVSRSSRKARTNAHPATVAAFAHLTVKPGRARQTSVGGWVK